MATTVKKSKKKPTKATRAPALKPAPQAAKAEQTAATARPAPLAKLERFLPWILIVCATVGIIASIVLAYDQIQIWKNPAYQPGCNLNPLISCGSVITSGKGEIDHIPGPLFGLLVFPVVMTIGASMLAGAKFKRWFWQGLQLGTTAGVIFALWMFWVALFQIHALCPYCLATDTAMYVLFWYVSLHNLQQEHIKTPSWLSRVRAFCLRHHLDILVAWFLILIAYTLYHFWYYFGQHI